MSDITDSDLQWLDSIVDQVAPTDPIFYPPFMDGPMSKHPRPNDYDENTGFSHDAPTLPPGMPSGNDGAFHHMGIREFDLP